MKLSYLCAKATFKSIFHYSDQAALVWDILMLFHNEDKHHKHFKHW